MRARRRAPGASAKARRDARTGHIHYDHEEFRINRAGKRTHYRFRATQVAEVVHLDEEERVRAVDCSRAPAALSLLLDEPRHREPFRLGVIVVGTEHWRCAAAPPPGGSDRPEEHLAAAGLMVRVLAVREAPCSAELRHGPDAGAPRSGVCLDMETEQASVADVFSDLDLLLDDEALTHPFAAGAAVPEELFRSPLGLPGFHPLHHSALGSAVEHARGAPSEGEGRSPHAREHGHGHGDGRRRLLLFGWLKKAVKAVAKAVNTVVAPIAKAVSTAAKAVATAVNVVTTTVSKAVNTVVTGAKKGLDALDRATGGKLSFITGPLKSGLDGVNKGVSKVMSGIGKAANSAAKLVSAVAQGIACVTGGCDLDYDDVLVSLSYNYDIDKRQQLNRLPPFDFSMDVKPTKENSKKHTEVGVGVKTVVYFDPEYCYFFAGAGLRIAIKLKDFNLLKFELIVYGEVDTRIKGNLALQIAATIEVLKTVYTKEFKTKTVTAGPVVFTFQPSLSVKIGFSGEVSLSFAQVLDGQITLGIEAGIVHRGGKFTPTAGWRNGKQPIVKIPKLDITFSIALYLILSPQLDLTAGVYGVQFLTGTVGLKFKIGFIWVPLGTVCGLPNFRITLGVVPFISFAFELSTVLKKPKDNKLSLDLFSHEFIIPPFDEFEVFHVRCDDAGQAADGVKESWTIQTTKRATNSIKLGWSYEPTSLIAEDVAIFRIQYRKQGSADPYTTAYVPITDRTHSTLAYSLGPRITNVATNGNPSLTITPDACPATWGFMMVVDKVTRRGHCRGIGTVVTPGSKYAFPEFLVVGIYASDLNSAFSYEITGLDTAAAYEINVSAQRVDGSHLFPSSATKSLTSSTLTTAPAPPSNVRFVQSKADPKAAGKYTTTIAWDAPQGSTAEVAFYQVLVSPRRLFTKATTPCTANRHRDGSSGPFAPCAADAPATSAKNAGGVATLIAAPASSIDYYDYVPTSPGSQMQIAIDGLEPGLVYNFQVQSMVGEGGVFRGSAFAASLSVQTPGFPDKAAVQPTTKLPLSLNVTRLSCRTYRVAWTVLQPRYGGGLIIAVVIKVVNTKTGETQYLPRGSNLLQTTVSLLEPGCNCETVGYTFVLGAMTAIGSKGDVASNTVSVSEAPCQMPPSPTAAGAPTASPSPTPSPAAAATATPSPTPTPTPAPDTLVFTKNPPTQGTVPEARMTQGAGVKYNGVASLFVLGGPCRVGGLSVGCNHPYSRLRMNTNPPTWESIAFPSNLELNTSKKASAVYDGDRIIYTYAGTQDDNNGGNNYGYSLIAFDIGFNNASVLTSSPAGGDTWRPRNAHCMTLYNGAVYISSGFNDQALWQNDVRKFTLSSSTWSQVLATSDGAAIPRREACTCALLGSKWYTLGGSNNVAFSANYFGYVDLAAGSPAWVAVSASIPSKRRFAWAFVMNVNSKDLLVAGGGDDGTAILNDAYVFKPHCNATCAGKAGWYQLNVVGSTPTETSGAFGYLPDTKTAYIFGGNKFGDESTLFANLVKIDASYVDDVCRPCPSRRRSLLDAVEPMSSVPPPDPVPDPNFVSTDNTVDPTLQAAANASAAPEDPSAVYSDGAGAYDNAWAVDLDAVYAALDNRSRAMLDDLRASREKMVFDFAALPAGSSLNQTRNDSISVDISASDCPPDYKLQAFLGRNTLASLCPYKVTGSTQVCGTASSHAVQFAFNATKTGLHRFSTAGGRPATLDVRSASGCSPLACNPPLTDGPAEVWLFLVGGTPLAINLAPAGADCSRTVALEISVEEPYGERVHVDAALGSDEAPLATFADNATAPALRRYATLDAALAYAYSRTLAAAGAALQVGVILQPGVYYRNASANVAWSSLAPASPLAAGAKIFIRSLSGGAEGPGSAADTILSCSGLGPAFTLAHASPLLVPLGVSISMCGAMQDDSSTDAAAGSAGAAVTYRGLRDVELRGVAFLLNSNAANTTAGVGGAVALVAGASVRFARCVFYQNVARVAAGAVAVLDGSDASFASCTFSGNAAPLGGAVLVGSDATAAGAVAFDGCAFRGNTARSPDAENPQPSAWRGGALALLRAASPVLVNGSTFTENAADAGAAVWAAAPLRFVNSGVSGSVGDGLSVQGAPAALEAVSFDGNQNLAVPDAGGGLTCAGAGASVSAHAVSFTGNAALYGGGALLRSGCSATFSLCEFASNFALVGAGACVGLLEGAAAAAGPVRFEATSFSRNNAGVDRDLDAQQEDGQHVGLGGGLAALSPAAASGCLFADNVAHSGAGLFAGAPVAVDGGSVFTRNEAGFPWLDGTPDAAAQVGGGALLSADDAAPASALTDVLFLANKARGAFGGGLAVVSGRVRLDAARVLTNAALAPLSQGAGLYFQRQASLADGSAYTATGNLAAGPYDNVLFADQLPTANSSAAGRRAFRSCGSCSLCQVCDASLGRCRFPSDLASWCEYVGGCNATNCPFVAVGGASFADGFRSLSIDFDADLQLPAAAAAPANSTVKVGCDRIFAANTSASLGAGAVCALQIGPRSRRSLRGAVSGATVSLGDNFGVQPGTTLVVDLAILSPLVQGMTSTAVIEVAQADVPLSAARAALQAARQYAGVAPYQGASPDPPAAPGALSPGAIVGIALGAAAAVLLLAAGVWLLSSGRGGWARARMARPLPLAPLEPSPEVTSILL